MRAASERQPLAIDHLARPAFLLRRLVRGVWRKILGILLVVVAHALGQRGEILLPVIPGQLHRRQRAAGRKAEGERRSLRKDKPVVPLQHHRIDLRRQPETQKLMGRVDQMRAPIAQGAIAEVKPRSPIAVDVANVVIMKGSRRQPAVPVERLGQGLLRQVVCDIHSVPAPGAVHEGRDPRHILDDARLDPGLELEIVRLGMPLISHLPRDIVFLLGRHHQADLPEAVPHRLLAINILPLRHRQHGDRKVGEVGHRHAHRINAPAEGVEHLPKIGEPRHIGKHLQNRPRVRRADVGVAQGHDVGLPRGVQRSDIIRSAVADAAAGEIHPLGRRRGNHPPGQQGGSGPAGGNAVDEGAAADGRGQARVQSGAIGGRMHGLGDSLRAYKDTPSASRIKTARRVVS